MIPAQPTVAGVLNTQFYLTVAAGRFCGQNYLAAAFTCPVFTTILPSAVDNLNLTGPILTPDQLQVCLPEMLAQLGMPAIAVHAEVMRHATHSSARPASLARSQLHLLQLLGSGLHTCCVPASLRKPCCCLTAAHCPSIYKKLHAALNWEHAQCTMQHGAAQTQLILCRCGTSCL